MTDQTRAADDAVVEAVARAMLGATFEETGESWDDIWDSFIEEVHERYRYEARKVIVAYERARKQTLEKASEQPALEPPRADVTTTSSPPGGPNEGGIPTDDEIDLRFMSQREPRSAIGEDGLDEAGRGPDDVQYDFIGKQWDRDKAIYCAGAKWMRDEMLRRGAIVLTAKQQQLLVEALRHEIRAEHGITTQLRTKPGTPIPSIEMIERSHRRVQALTETLAMLEEQK